MARNSTERLGASTRSGAERIRFFLYTESTQPFQACTNNVVFAGFKGVVFLPIPRTALVQYHST